MNLVEYLKEEVERLHLQDKLEIAKFIYWKTGELFDYNQALFCYPKNSVEREKVINEKIDIYNIKSPFLICTSWAKMYVELLQEFEIPAKIVDFGEHRYVKILVDEKEVVADLTWGIYKDISMIKLGFRPNNFVVNGNNTFENNFQMNDYHGISTEQALAILKTEVNLDKYSRDVKVKKAFEIVQLIINIERSNVYFNSGFNLILKLLDYFLEIEAEFVEYTCCYNADYTSFFGVFRSFAGVEDDYYIYEQEEDHFYHLKKVSGEQVDNLMNSHKCLRRKFITCK